MLWLSLNFYQLPLDVFLLESSNSLLHECEFVVVENGLLVYCNQAAIDKGLEAGMKVSTAYALSNELKVKQRNHNIEKNTLTQLATLAYEFSSQVCLYDQQTILLEVQASCKLFASLCMLLEKLADRLSLLQVRYFSALSATPKAAYLLGLYQQWTIDQLVITANKQSLPELIQQSKEQLEQVPVAYLGYESEFNSNIKISRIKEMGIKVLGEIINLPGSAIGRRFGKAFLQYLYRLKGDVNDPQDLFSIPEVFSIQRCFVNGLDTIEQILFPAKPMLESLTAFLKIRRVMAVNIIWRFHCFNSDELLFEIALSSEVQNAEQLLMLTRLKLQTFILREKVETVFLESKEFIGLKERQCFLDLNDDRTEILNGSEEIDSLMDKLKVRLGSERCSGLLLKDDYLPENLSSNISVLDEKALDDTILKTKSVSKTKSTSQEKTFDLLNEQPLWLLDKPKVISVFRYQDKQKLNCGEPLNYRVQPNYRIKPSYRGALSIISNPERIENSWWINNQQRDYYIAENKVGIRYWIYRDLATDQWLLHGVF